MLELVPEPWLTLELVLELLFMAGLVLDYCQCWSWCWSRQQ